MTDHLKYDPSTGHLMHNAAGHLIHECGGVTVTTCAEASGLLVATLAGITAGTCAIGGTFPVSPADCTAQNTTRVLTGGSTATWFKPGIVTIDGTTYPCTAINPYHNTTGCCLFIFNNAHVTINAYFFPPVSGQVRVMGFVANGTGGPCANCENYYMDVLTAASIVDAISQVLTSGLTMTSVCTIHFPEDADATCEFEATTLALH